MPTSWCRSTLLLAFCDLNSEVQASVRHGLLLRKSHDGRGAAFVGLLADKLKPDAHFKFNVFFRKTGAGSASQPLNPKTNQARAAKEAPSISLKWPWLTDQHPAIATSHDVPFDGLDCEDGITIPDDLFPEVQVGSFDMRNPYTVSALTSIPKPHVASSLSQTCRSYVYTFANSASLVIRECAQLPDFSNAHQGLIDGSHADEGQNGWSVMPEDVNVDDQVCSACLLAAMHPFSASSTG